MAIETAGLSAESEDERRPDQHLVLPPKTEAQYLSGAEISAPTRDISPPEEATKT